MARGQGRRSSGAKPPDPPVALDWVRYYCGRGLQFGALVILTGVMALFFGAENMERRMLVATALAGALFVVGRLLSRKRPRGARPDD